MDIRLISQDRDLYKLCREVIADIPGHDCLLTATDSEREYSEADLHVWDFEPKALLPEHIKGNLSIHLFLVDRKDVPSFRLQIYAAETQILLKPVTRATLGAFLELAIAAHQDRLSPSRSLRADRDEILQCLIQTNLKLQEYDQDRTNFLARAVHDFRAPLTALNGYCGLLLSEPLGPLSDSQREILRRMQNSAKRLSRMASAMFQLSVGRQVKKRAELRLGDLNECMEQALHEIAPFAEEKTIAIGVDMEPGVADLYFEPGEIVQVIVNVLDNACKFTRRAGSIKISGYPYFLDRRKIDSTLEPGMERRRENSRAPNSYRVDIANSGETIPEEHLGGIFEERTSFAGGRDRSGGGLGLAICKLLISQHEGHVWAENTDFGPMFSFVLPTQCPKGAAIDNIRISGETERKTLCKTQEMVEPF